ncbi:hypothetical protein DFP72DRAFT_413685 [Ephemerocybe angulata]|uniref:Uncharacterized protein n=1 Tax=Ephemerocybe angulata TaxID=980116 RepID=A0A8H6MFI5_9AGAR|nr:hypothetical protein DFP72DRAFT_413685 [Tulosesus angulatus]
MFRKSICRPLTRRLTVRRLALASLPILALAYYAISRSKWPVEIAGPRIMQAGASNSKNEPWMSPSNYMNSPRPMALALDNLRNDTNYVTGFAISGFTNQFIAYMHIVYLAMLSNRVPIIPPLVPAAHINTTAPSIPFSLIFSLPHLRHALRLPIIEWSELKSFPASPPAPYPSFYPANLDPPEEFSTTSTPASTPNPDSDSNSDTEGDWTRLDALGCWSLRQRSFPYPTWSVETENALRLDVSYTRVPDMCYLDEDDFSDEHTVFAKLAALIMPTPGRGRSLTQKLGGGGEAKGIEKRTKTSEWIQDEDGDWDQLEHLGGSRFGYALAPSHSPLACFDFLYYVSTGLKKWEFEERWSPAWNIVGTHLKWDARLEGVARGYVRRAFGLSPEEELPPMITVHIRRGDFASGAHCPPSTPFGKACYIPLEKYQKAVTDLQAGLSKALGMKIDKVLVASDEESLEFWSNITSYGWSHINHTAPFDRAYSKATQTYLDYVNEWLPILVDQAAMSLGLGFVGTRSSTYSILSARRVEDWNGGMATLVSA